MTQPVQVTLPAIEPIEDDDFFEDVKRFFEKSSIIIKEQRLQKRNSEIDFVIVVPTVVGNVEFFCKAKKKERNTDTDLAYARLQAETKNLPTLYLTTGEITKKAEEMLKHEFRGMTVMRFS